MRAAIKAGQKCEESKPQQRKCIACNGSGRYDHNGSPKCGACNGTGYEEIEHEFRKSSNV